MVEIKEKFIPLHKLIITRAKALSPRQRELIELHRQAKTDRDALENVANAITRESLLASGGKAVEAFAKVDNVSDASTSAALSAAVKYYNDHRRIERAFDELRKHSDRHWMPIIEWTEAFCQHAKQHGVKFTPKLLKKIKRYEAQMNAAGKWAELIIKKNEAKIGRGLN